MKSSDFPKSGWRMDEKYTITQTIGAYFERTYNHHQLLIGLEILIIVFFYVDPKISSPFFSKLLSWHSLIMNVVVLFPCMYSIFGKVIAFHPPARKHYPTYKCATPNIMIALCTMFFIGNFARYFLISVAVLLIPFYTTLVLRLNNVIQVSISSVLGGLMYLCYRKYGANYLKLSFVASFFLPFIASLDKEAAITSKGDQNNYHALLVQNFGYVVFEAFSTKLHSTNALSNVSEPLLATGMLLNFTMHYIADYMRSNGKTLLPHEKRQ